MGKIKLGRQILPFEDLRVSPQGDGFPDLEIEMGNTLALLAAMGPSVARLLNADAFGNLQVAPGVNAFRQYYDRNPIKKSIIDAIINIAPHADVSRGAYTVPSGKLFMVETVFGAIQQLTAQTVAANVNTQVRLTQIDVGEAFGPKLFEAFKFNGAVGSTGQSSVANCMFAMKAGDIATLWDGDQGTGGTVAYDSSLSGAEFDA